MSSEELARLCGLDRTSIVNIEHLKKLPSLNTLILMIYALGMKISITPLDVSEEVPIDLDWNKIGQKATMIAEYKD